MTQFLKKNAKPIYIVYGVLCFIWLIVACVYITPYARTLLQFTQLELDNPGSINMDNPTLLAFCSGIASEGKTGIELYNDYFLVLFNFNQKLQTVNNMLVTLGVVSLVTFAAMLICSNISRKKYYISNLVSGVAGPAINIVLAIVVLVLNLMCLGPLNENYEMLNWGALANNQRIGAASVIEWYRAGDISHFEFNSVPLILYSVLIIVFILVSGLLIAYNVFRYLDTRNELNQTVKVVEE